MLQRETLKGWNKWYAQVEEYWRLQKIMARMKNTPLARAFDQWCNALVADTALARKQRAQETIKTLKKLARAWRNWKNMTFEAIARGRIRDTFRFSKNPDESDMYSEAVDWRASLNRGRTKGPAI